MIEFIVMTNYSSNFIFKFRAEGPQRAVLTRAQHAAAAKATLIGTEGEKWRNVDSTKEAFYLPDMGPENVFTRLELHDDSTIVAKIYCFSSTTSLFFELRWT
jgi:hypothetical protein